jgi:hypothetical protein
MTTVERIGNMVVVRWENPAKTTGLPEGRTINNASLEWLKKYSSPKPLWPPQPWRPPPEEADNEGHADLNKRNVLRRADYRAEAAAIGLSARLAY